jgi:hypothetical protein
MNGSRRHPNKRRRHREVGAAAGCAIFLVGSGAAFGADAPAATGDNEEIGEVVVTGLRKSIQDSIDRRRRNRQAGNPREPRCSDAEQPPATIHHRPS